MALQVKKLVDYWYREARYSLDVAEALFEEKKFPESLFFLHLTLEKQLRALVVAKTKQHAPDTHNLIELLKQTGLKYSLQHISSFGRYNKYYTVGRYNDPRGKFRKICTYQYANGNLKKIMEYYKWLTQEIKKTLVHIP